MFERISFLLYLAAVCLLFIPTVPAAQNSIWLGNTGDWSNSENWNPAEIPDNGTNTYNVFIGSDNTQNSSVYLDTNIEVDSVTIDFGDSLFQNAARYMTIAGGGINNNGTWNMDGDTGSASLTRLRFKGGSQTLDGSGELVLNDYPKNRVDMYSYSDTLTQGANHTIRGSGTLLGNYGNMINNGTVLATGDNYELIIDPRTTFSNFGELRAEGTAGLQFNAGDFELNDTTVEVAAGSKLTVGFGAVVKNGTLSSSGSGQVIADNGSDFDNITTASGTTVTHQAGDNVEIYNGLTNNGTWNMDGDTGSSANTILRFSGGSQTLGGSGELVLNDYPKNRVYMNYYQDTLTQGANHTIRGSGSLLGNYGNMLNNGTVLATGDNHELIIDPRTTFSNLGTLRAEGTAGLQFNAGDFELNDTAVEVAAGSKLTVGFGAVVKNGTLSSSGSGQVIADNGSDFDNITTASGTTVTHQAGDNVEIYNGLTNNGQWNMDGNTGSSANTTLRFSGGDQILDGSGELVLNDYSKNLVNMNTYSDTLTQSADHTIRGSGTLLNNYGNMVNNGTILATGDNYELIIDPRTTFSNYGTLRAEGTAGLKLNAGDFELNNTTIEVADGSQVTIGYDAVVKDGTLASSGSGQVIADNGSDFDNITTASGTTVIHQAGDNVEIYSGLTNNGQWNMDGDTGSSANTTLRFSGGDQTLGGSGELVLNDYPKNRVYMNYYQDTLTQGANHTIRGSGSLLGNSGNMVNNGTILATGVNHDLVINPRDYFINNPGGVLGGTGRMVFDDEELTNNGIISPGLSAGELTILGDVVNGHTSVLSIELGGWADGEFDSLYVGGDFRLGGDINVSLIDGFIPDVSDDFTILQASSLSGECFNNAIPDIDGIATDITTGGVTFDVTYNFNAGTVSLTNIVPEPATIILLGLGGFFLHRRNF